MSVDPFIQGVGNSQGINPYSYVMNNPLAFTDPSGYCAAETGTRIKKCVDVEVTNTDTGEVSTTSMNIKHSNFAGNVASYAASKLGNGAQITGMSATMKNGNTVDLMSQASTSKASVGTPAGDGKARDGDFQINEKPLREMLFNADTYGGAIANLSSSLHDNELRDILGDRYRDYVNELGDAFKIGWDKVILAKSIMAPGFMASGLMGYTQAAGSYARNSIIRQQIQTARSYVRPNGAVYHEVSPTRLIVSENHFGDISRMFNKHNGTLNFLNKDFWKHVLPHKHIYDATRAPAPKANMRKAFEKAGAKKTTVWGWE